MGRRRVKKYPKPKPVKVRGSIRRQETRAVKQASRMSDLARTIATRHGVTIDELMVLYKTSKRTIYRDLEALEAQGYPLIREQKGLHQTAIRMRPGFTNLPQVTLGLAEIVSLYVIRSQIHFLSGTNFQADMDRLFDRLEKGLPEKDQKQLRSIGRKFFPRPEAPKSYEAKIDLIDDLIDALIRQHKVDLEYRPPAGKTANTRHRVRPYTLLTYQEGLYLIGFSETAGGIRTFAVDRMVDLQPLRTSLFDYPEEFTPSEYLADSFGIIRGEPVKIRIRFSPGVATFIAERRFHPGQKITRHADGSLTLEMRVAVSPELVTLLLGYGPDAKVLEPESLAATVADRQRQAAKQYS